MEAPKMLADVATAAASFFYFLLGGLWHSGAELFRPAEAIEMIRAGKVAGD